MIDFSIIAGFDWDDGNSEKNWIKHQVSTAECEQVFFDPYLLIQSDDVHSQQENRYLALGAANAGRRLFIAFTIRKDRIRVISARDMNRKEQKYYEENTSIQK